MSTEAESIAFACDGSRIRSLVLAPHEEYPFDPDDWRRALIVVQHGTLRLRCRSGREVTYSSGSLLYFDGLPLQAIGAEGAEAVVLMTVHAGDTPRGHPAEPLTRSREDARTMNDTVATAQIDIHATPRRVWAALTDPEQISVYMFGTRVQTTWEVGTPITWSGIYDGRAYQDRGEVLAYDEPQTLSVTHYSPLGGEEDRPENYHTLVYTLAEDGAATHVTLTQDGCADKAQAEQFSQNWLQMLTGLRAHVEG